MNIDRAPKQQLRRIEGRPHWFRSRNEGLCVGIRSVNGNSEWETYSFDRARMLETLSWEDWDSVKALCFCRGKLEASTDNEGTIPG